MEPKQIGAAIRAFRAEKCPVCGDKKKHLTDAFCIQCLSYLSDELRQRMSTTKKFIETFHPAVAYIKRHRPQAPASAARGRRESQPGLTQ